MTNPTPRERADAIGRQLNLTEFQITVVATNITAVEQAAFDRGIAHEADRRRKTEAKLQLIWTEEHEQAAREDERRKWGLDANVIQEGTRLAAEAAFRRGAEAMREKIAATLQDREWNRKAAEIRAMDPPAATHADAPEPVGAG